MVKIVLVIADLFLCETLSPGYLNSFFILHFTICHYHW